METHIVERLSDFINNGELNCNMIHLESEFAALSAAIGVSATGSRVFTATASQGLALMNEVLHATAGMRFPIVMAVANRALSAPINIWCFTKEAEVLMKDLTYKPISKVKKGDMITGKDKKGNLVFTKVTKTFKHNTNNLIKLKTSKFNITCTPNHRFYDRRGHRHWTKACNLKNKKLHWFGHGYKNSNEFKRGWLAGMADGDGCFYSQKGRYYYRLKVKDEILVDKFVEWGNKFNFPVRKVNYLRKEGYFIAILTSTQKTKLLEKFINKKGNKDYSRGYLSGMYDAEESGPHKCKQATIYNSNIEIIKKVEQSLNKIKLKFKRYVDKRSMNYHVKINNVPEFFIKCSPSLERKRENLLRMTLKSVKTRLQIEDIKLVKKDQIVYNLETETHNYIVNGLLVHNCDHQDSISARDTGWIQLYVESAQEALDTIIMAFKIAENKKVLTPVMVCLDGFTLSHVYEPVDIPIQSQVRKFLPKFKPDIFLDPKKPITMGPLAFPDVYMEIKKDQQDAIMNSLPIIKTTNSQFFKSFKRKYGDGLVETYKTKDANIIIIAMGTVCSTTRTVIDELRKEKKTNKVGLLKVKCFRPFPEEEIKKELKKAKKIIVIDKDMSYGHEGALFSEIRSVLYGERKDIKGYIAGLGGRDVTPKHIRHTLTNKSKGKTEWLM